MEISGGWMRCLFLLGTPVELEGLDFPVAPDELGRRHGVQMVRVARCWVPVWSRQDLN